MGPKSTGASQKQEPREADLWQEQVLSLNQVFLAWEWSGVGFIRMCLTWSQVSERGPTAWT